VSGKTSTLFTVGTLLRHAQDAGAPVRVLVEGTWLDGRIVGADSHGVVLDDGNGQQVLVRLDAIIAVSFSRADIDDPDADPDEDARSHGRRRRDPIEAGPVGG
jgi:sRNA-binding regulator protein Hfq